MTTRIGEENARPGTKAWWKVPHVSGRAIEGYATQTSVRPGGQLELCVSTTPAQRYRVTLFRLGWYGGAGARQITQTAGNVGLARPMDDPDPATGLNVAGWPVTDVIPMPPDAVSGWWLAHLELLTGPQAGQIAHVPFVVRPGVGDAPAILVQTGVNTLQAYNHWGGKCLYTSNSTDGVAARKVSFDRPVLPWDESNLNSKAPFHYDVPLMRWLERHGYDVGYQTNVDTHREPWSLLTPRLIMSSGHDEYWTAEIRDAMDAARDRGTNLAFLGANAAYWQVRYEDDERTLVCFKSAGDDPEPDRGGKTVQFRQLAPIRDERWLVGIQYEGGLTHPTRLFDYEVDPASLSDTWMRGTGLEDLRPVAGVVGYEWDALDERDPPAEVVRFLRYDNPLSNAACTRWTAQSGARIFATGSLGFALALDDWTRPGTADDRVQRLFANVVDDLAG